MCVNLNTALGKWSVQKPFILLHSSDEHKNMQYYIRCKEEEVFAVWNQIDDYVFCEVHFDDGQLHIYTLLR